VDFVAVVGYRCFARGFDFWRVDFCTLDRRPLARNPKSATGTNSPPTKITFLSYAYVRSCRTSHIVEGMGKNRETELKKIAHIPDTRRINNVNI